MTTSSSFPASVEREFSYLVERFGFARTPLAAAGSEAWIVFRKHPVELTVSWELGSGSSVALRHLAPGNSRGSFGLHEFFQELKREPMKDTLREPQSLEEWAAFLEKYGSEMLRGDFRLLFERDARNRMAVKRNNEGAV